MYSQGDSQGVTAGRCLLWWGEGRGGVAGGWVSWQYVLEVELAGPAGEFGLEGGRMEENQSTVYVCVFLMRWGNQEWSKLGNSILKCLSGVSREVGI